ncbi:glutaminyl-peptide cyclotransferase [Fulvimonas soli]|jgi:glutaminyl-peptide cyclotransferase|uniref:Glutaminyl-peptide cyclotransferase n=1 Tax=Fulvimonas soli TaxID=155197 RepID=A0A316I126_9GAMM|nr:glutaminyl-peptide cyclotransferase [Fulvimonas soli]PWK86821.1 glutaminyl-peptide cyclotransferase [Fulvimonas soli]TNY27197.1 glutamine cyclotransferase [Fulvimonas soli]
MDTPALRCLLPVLLLAAGAAQAAIPVYGYRVVRSYPHDTGAYTEGLFYRDGHFYESTGTVGQSSIRKVDPATGEAVQRRNLPPPDYGEGIVAWKNRLYELTWQSQHGYIYDLATFAPLGSFTYPGEGWALTTDGTRLYMSDGTPDIRVLDPVTLDETARIRVTADGQPLANLNELEWVKGELYANVWLTDRIARIDPKSGRVTAWIDLAGLAPKPDETADPTNDVLNGIAYDAARDRLFVTGKRWPKIYEIELVAPAPAP